MRILKMALAMALSIPVFGCAGNYIAADQSKAWAPANYRQVIAQRLRSRLFDPYSVREAAISKPQWGVMGPHLGERLFFCVRYNAKNRFGGYIGTKFYTIGWNTDNNFATGDAFFEEDFVCSKVALTPFPELGNPN